MGSTAANRRVDPRAALQFGESHGFARIDIDRHLEPSCGGSLVLRPHPLIRPPRPSQTARAMPAAARRRIGV